MRTINFLLAIALGLALQPLSAEPIPVTTEPLYRLLTPQAYNAPATVKPLNRTQLAAQVTGQVQRLSVLVGDRVQAGQELVELDCRSHRQQLAVALASLAKAKAQLNFAQAQLRRARDLKQKNTISDELLEQRRTELASVQADIQHQQANSELAQIAVDHCRIQAPFDALVSQRIASQGDLASPGTALLELVQLSQAEVSAELREHQADSLPDADQIVFRYQDKDYPLQLRVLPPLVDERNRTREARLQFIDNAAPVGAAGRLHWQSNAQMLPAHYLERRGDQLGIFIADQGKARFVSLGGAREGQPAPISLDSAQRLITEGRQRLRHGDSIRAQPAGAVQ